MGTFNATLVIHHVGKHYLYRIEEGLVPISLMMLDLCYLHRWLVPLGMGIYLSTEGAELPWIPDNDHALTFGTKGAAEETLALHLLKRSGEPVCR